MKKVLLGLGFLAALLTACPPPPAPSARAYLGTQAPGDVWTWSITPSASGGSSGNFSATNETLSRNYAGTYTTLTTGYMKLTATSSNEPGFTAPQYAYALEVPNTALIVKPVGSSGAPITMVSQGSCPSVGALVYNYIIIPRSAPLSTDLAVDDAFGWIDGTVSGVNLTGTLNLRKLDGSNFQTGSSSLGSSLNCSGGRFITTDAGNTSTSSFTASGIGFTDHGPNRGGNLFIQTPSSAVSWAALRTKNFIGLTFNNTSSGDKTQPVKMEAHPTNALATRGSTFTDVETGAVGSETVTIVQDTGVSNNQPRNGLLLMTQTSSAGSPTPRSLAFTTGVVGGKQFIFGIAKGSSNTDVQNFLLVERTP